MNIYLLSLLFLGIILVKLNKRNLVVVVIMLLAYFLLESNKKPLLYSEKNKLYLLNCDNIIEPMTTLVPEANTTTLVPEANTTTLVPEANTTTLVPEANMTASVPEANMTNWVPNDFIEFNKFRKLLDDTQDLLLVFWDDGNDGANDVRNRKCNGSNCTDLYQELNNKSEFEKYVKRFEQYIDKHYDTLYDDWKEKFIDSHKWQFRIKENVYYDNHSHHTIGELIYHLKLLDLNIYNQIYNSIGLKNKSDMNELYQKVKSIKDKMPFLEIERDSKLYKKITLIHDILQVINSNYQSFPQISDGNTVAFKKKESCKRVTKTIKKSEYGLYDVEVGCPPNHYMKGIQFEQDESNENYLKKTVICCELNSEQGHTANDEDAASNDLFIGIDCNDKPLNSFSYMFRQTSQPDFNYDYDVLINNKYNKYIESDSVTYTFNNLNDFNQPVYKSIDGKTLEFKIAIKFKDTNETNETNYYQKYKITTNNNRYLNIDDNDNNKLKSVDSSGSDFKIIFDSDQEKYLIFNGSDGSSDFLKYNANTFTFDGNSDNATKFTIKKVNDYYTFQFDINNTNTTSTPIQTNGNRQYLSINNNNIFPTTNLTNNCKFKLNDTDANVIFEDTKGLKNESIQLSDSTNTNTNTKTISKPVINSFYIKNKNKFLERQLDYSTKKYSLTTIEDSDERKPRFEITKDENNYYIKIKHKDKYYNRNSTTKAPSEINIDKYLSVQGNKVIFVKEKEDRTSFNLIQYKNTFIIKNSFDNLALTVENSGNITMSNLVSYENPHDNQLFLLQQTMDEQHDNLKLIKNCINTNVGNSETETETSNIIITDNIPIGSFICPKDKYISKIYKNNNNNKLVFDCIKIKENSDNGRDEFFKFPIDNFKHSHEFILGESIHNHLPYFDLKKTDENEINRNLELYSPTFGYLNNTSSFSSIQKIYIMLIVLRLNGVHKTNIDYNSLYSFFREQQDLSDIFKELIQPRRDFNQTTNPPESGIYMCPKNKPIFNRNNECDEIENTEPYGSE